MKIKLYLFLFTILSITTIFAQNQKEIIARNWIEDNKVELKIQDNHTLDMQFSRVGLSGETFRFYQMMNGVQVFDAELTVHVSNINTVTFYTSTYDAYIETISTIPRIKKSQAIEIAKKNIKNKTKDIAFMSEKLFVYNKTGTTILAYVIRIEPKKSPIGSWEIVVNAQTGEVLSVTDKALNHKDKSKGKKKQKPIAKNNSMMLVNGSGFVFETDPLTKTQNQYGGQYIDANDATNAALDAARTNVPLLDITQLNGAFFLRGPFVEIVDFQSPNKGLFSQSSSAFNFNREEDGFEAVNVYYHIDKSMRYINNILGITLMPYQYNTGVKADPSGQNGADNSQYVVSSGRLTFGEGCVDDAEDADVILHELAHGLHDWLTNGGISQENGLSEGCGDYWANSYKRSLGKWSVNDQERNWTFGWDGHNECWNGRTTVYSAEYPTNLTGSIHTDGQMWAATLIEIWEIIGKEKTDKAFLEGLGMTNSSTNQEDAAIAVRQAAIDMGIEQGFTCDDIQVFTERFTARGYNMSANKCNIIEEEETVEDETGLIFLFPNPTNGVITFKNIKNELNVTIINMIGQKVQSQIINETSNAIDVSNLATGAYFVKLNTDGTVLRFIKE